MFVTMYAKDACSYCRRAEALLLERGCTDIRKLRIDLDPALRTEMVERTGLRTVPQIYIGDVHISGLDRLVELDRIGELVQLLQTRDRHMSGDSTS